MKARSRALVSTLILLLVAAGALLIAWFGIGKKDEAREVRQASEAKLYAFAPADVTGVTVESKGDVTRLARAADSWRVEAPVRASAERAAVEGLVDRIADLRRKAAIAEASTPDALARYGLERPRAKVTLTLKDGKTETLALGDENAFDGTAFVRTTSGAVALVPGDLKWAVERSAFDFREKRLLPFEDKDVQRLEVMTPALAYVLVREGADAWRLEAPAKERADDSTVSRVLGAVRGARAASYHPAGTAAISPKARRWNVTLVSPGGARRSMTLRELPRATGADAAPGFLATVEGASEEAVVGPDATKDLDQDLFALRDKTVLRFDRDAVASVRFDRGGAASEVRRDSAPDRIAGYTWTLASLRAKAFVDESGSSLREHGLDRPALTVTLLGGDGKELGRLLVSAPRDGRIYAKGYPSPRLVEVDPGAISQLTVDPGGARP